MHNFTKIRQTMHKLKAFQVIDYNEVRVSPVMAVPGHPVLLGL